MGLLQFLGIKKSAIIPIKTGHCIIIYTKTQPEESKFFWKEVEASLVISGTPGKWAVEAVAKNPPLLGQATHQFDEGFAEG